MKKTKPQDISGQRLAELVAKWPVADDDVTKLRPRKTTAERANQIADLLFIEVERGVTRDELAAHVEIALNKEAGRAYDAFVRSQEQVMARGTKCPTCRRSKPKSKKGS
jgi:uncharacterized protein (DUF1697 family)